MSPVPSQDRRAPLPRGASRSAVLGSPLRATRRTSELAAGRLSSGALARAAPGAVVTFAAVQGGVGVSTLTLLVCGAVTRASRRPAVALDLAHGTRGGLGALAGAWSQCSAESTAEHVLAGATLARPYAHSSEGVHIISDEPQARVAAERIARRLLAQTAAVVRGGGDDGELAALARVHAEDAALDELAGPNPARRRDALGKLIDAARGPHSLVGVDLGLADDALLEQCTASSDLHVWVVAARRDDIEVARRRLLGHEPVAGRELVLAWLPDGRRVGSRELRDLGAARGCPVVRLARFDRAATWESREQDCRSALEALCSQLA